MEKHTGAGGRHFPVDTLEFFHVNDALEVSWAHAVNSHVQLQQALSGEVITCYYYFMNSINNKILHCDWSSLCLFLR